MAEVNFQILDQGYGSYLYDIIPKDQNEIIFHLGLARSMVRRCDGTLLVESLGKGEPNICQITFPIGKITKK